MPPSPSWRYSPAKELRAANHKRGRSFDGGLLFKEKDDDLALFNNMHMKEKDNFLLESNDDDLDESFSMKLRYFSTSKPSITIPVLGESSDLLTGEGDKNDYDWLLTPPGSPLFPSLDDETPPENLSRIGRPRSQPVSVTRSATTERSYRGSRSSASPHRLSPSPILQSRGRSSSASRSSPNPTSRARTPSRSPANPPNKPSTPPQNSSTPTLQRTSSGLSGASLAKTSRGNSPSPTSKAWQSGIPGFSSEAPPNLRTSIADRPASYVRGSSPASRNGRGSSPASRNGRGSSPSSRNGRGASPASRSGRQSMSPTASRSASSSYSHDRDRLSSQSKGSVASSGDDDRDSLQSVSVNVSTRSAARKVGVFPNSKVPTFSKKLSGTLSPSSAPKRSFDSALRKMDKKNPQTMFRPLLSSVPSTTFFVGKASSAYHPTISRNSSVATSSNASSGQGESVELDTGGNDPCQDDNTEHEKGTNPDAQDEVPIFDKLGGTNEDFEPEMHNGISSLARCSEFEGTTSEVRAGESKNFGSHNAAASPTSTSSSLHNKEFVCHEDNTYCSKCGRSFSVVELIEENDRICQDCCKKDVHLPLTTTEIPEVVIQNSKIYSETNLEVNRCFDDLELKVGVPEVTELSKTNEALPVHDEINLRHGRSCSLDSSPARSAVEDGKHHLVIQQVVGQATVGFNHSDSLTVDQQLLHNKADPSLKIGVSDGDEISILLKRSSSSKLHISQGRDFSAANVPHDYLSYARDGANRMRSSILHGSVSASSSVDFSPSKQEAHFQRQISGRKTYTENSGHDLITEHRRRGSSFSERSDHSCQSLVLCRSVIEENFNTSAGNVENNALEEILQLFTEEQGKDVMMDDNNSSFSRAAVLEREKMGFTESCQTIDSSASELLNHTLGTHLEDTSVETFPDVEYCISSELNNCVENGHESIEDPTHGLLVTVCEELENGHECIFDPQADRVDTPISECGIEKSNKLSLSMTSEEGTPVSARSILEDPSDAMGCQEQETRSLSMEEEANDTLLFCVSIVHNLAYQAATIAMEKENSIPLEGFRPTVTTSNLGMGKTSSDRKDSRGRGVSKRSSKSQKARQRRMETDGGKILGTKSDTNIKSHESMKQSSMATDKVDSLRPPKLESKCNCTVM